jgi:hypothetical protein
MTKTFKTACCPDADGRTPLAGEQKWTLNFPLEGGDDVLFVEMGKKGRDAIVAMLRQEEKDDDVPRVCDACGYQLMNNGCCSRVGCYNSD